MGEAKRILVIDDDPDFLDFCQIVLASQGYAVETATTASQGLQAMRGRPPALVLADVMMSYVLDGYTISREMLADPILCSIPIVMVSAIVSLKDHDLFPAAERERISGFMSKPVDPAALLRTVAELTRERGG
ncbi:MAG: response regulator [Chloroflexota bacterium]